MARLWVLIRDLPLTFPRAGRTCRRGAQGCRQGSELQGLTPFTGLRAAEAGFGAADQELRAPITGSELPTRASGPPSRGPELPTRGSGSGLPARGSALPTRTTRFRRPGRHRSPHQLSVPSDAPALILAVPGAVTDAAIDIVAGIIDVASQSCPGVTVRAGFLEGTEESLSSVLAACQSVNGRPAAVVVPLLICPQPEADAEIAAEIAAAAVPVLQTAALGVHPTLAGALHARLAEAGLARGDRIGRISIVSSAAEGVLVTALGTDAMSIAGTAAVLLAARLALPVAAASLSEPSQHPRRGGTAVRFRCHQPRPVTLCYRAGNRRSRPRRGRQRSGNEDSPATGGPAGRRPARRHALRGRAAGSPAGRHVELSRPLASGRAGGPAGLASEHGRVDGPRVGRQVRDLHHGDPG